MNRAISMALAFWGCRSGATSIEYGVIASVISIGIVVGARMIGVNLNALFFSKVQNGFN